MEPAVKISVPHWLTSTELSSLMKVLGAQNANLVGGCVRNAIIEADQTDIDIATTLKPEEVMKKCNEAGFKTIPTGIDHGTVTVVVNEKPFEITTLRQDVQTDGRHAQVEFSDDWLEDAKRRDFTMNALYMDLEGNVYDPLDQGLKDLKDRQVRFVGDAQKRIQEDYLRILRFFRFYSQYGEGGLEQDALKACAQFADKIETLSRERITQEFLKILNSGTAADILHVMFENGILADLPNTEYNSQILSRLTLFQKNHDVQNDMARLFVLGGNKPNLFEKYLRLSHAQMKFLIKLEMAVDQKLYESEKTIKKAIFYHGNELLVQGYLLSCAIEGQTVDQDMLDILQNWQAPDCPITGETLLAEGFQTGPELGIELNRRIDEWLEEIY